MTPENAQELRTLVFEKLKHRVVRHGETMRSPAVVVQEALDPIIDYIARLEKRVAELERNP